MNNIKNEINKNIKIREEIKKQKEYEFSLNQYKIANINNNIDLLLNKIVINELFTILKKYQDKKISEKTKEKMCEELKKYVLDKYGFNLYFNFYKVFDFSKTYKISFYFNNVGEIIKNYNPETKEIYNYFANLDYKYISLDKIENYSQKMLYDRLEIIDKINDLNKKIDNLRYNFNKKYVFNKTNDFKIEMK